MRALWRLELAFVWDFGDVLMIFRQSKRYSDLCSPTGDAKSVIARKEFDKLFERDCENLKIKEENKIAKQQNNNKNKHQ